MAVEVPAAAPVMAQLLFVQNAHGFEVAADGRTLTLKGLSPTTLFFSDRPVRIAGHYLTGEYLQFWKAGPDSFLKDPPNATLSVFEKGKDELSDVVVTLRNPRVNGNDLSYDITVISGTLPKTSGPGVAVHRHHRVAVHAAVVRRRCAAHRLPHRGLGQRRASRPRRPSVYAAPAPTTVHITETVQAPPAPPAVNPTQAAAVAKLKELKSLQTQGLITEADYQAASQKLLNQIVQ